MCVCGYLDCNNFIEDIMVVLPELYMSSMFEILLVVLIVAELGLMVADPEIIVVVVS